MEKNGRKQFETGIMQSRAYTASRTLTERMEEQRTAQIAASLINAANYSNGAGTAVRGEIPRSPIPGALLTPKRPASPPEFAIVSTTIGYGIDKDVTDAAVKAIRDAMERGMLQFFSSSQQLHIQLGVPANQQQPMRLDAGRLTAVLPPNVRCMPIQVQVGGLLVPPISDSSSGGIPTCVVVGCLTVHQQVNWLKSPKSVTSSPQHQPRVATAPQIPLPPPQHQQKQQLPHQLSPMLQSFHTSHPQQHQTSAWTTTPEAEQCQQPRTHNFHPHPQTINNGPGMQKEQNHHERKHTNSIDMLAHVSAEMIGEREHQMHDKDDEDKSGIRYNYKKLPPGKTPKNHNRLFVKHVYRDHSHEVPLPEELSLVGPNAPELTPNAAFPLKLHETLTQIEHDGLDHIVGWLPHGRSFKIHEQKEFVEIILPKYFVMTKKSSFLRQLNLYGFNRLSGAGNDQGSYYHEKFLRGMKFLSRRMQRQKVNGNGIRAAGNPDEEPNLDRFPVCPPTHITSQESSSFARSVRPMIDQPEACEDDDEIMSDAASNEIKSKPTHKKTYSDRSIDSSLQDVEAMMKSHTSLQACFPLKLHRILDKLEAEGKTDILSWLSHGRAFLVHDADRFVEEIMPVYFNQTKYSSFQRQCHMYNFQRITAGTDKGAYHHPNFLRGRPELSVKIQRTRVNGKGTRRPGNPDKEPDFYSMPQMPPIPPGTIIDIPLDVQHQSATEAGCGESHTSGTSASGDD